MDPTTPYSICVKIMGKKCAWNCGMDGDPRSLFSCPLSIKPGGWGKADETRCATGWRVGVVLTIIINIVDHRLQFFFRRVKPERSHYRAKLSRSDDAVLISVEQREGVLVFWNDKNCTRNQPNEWKSMVVGEEWGAIYHSLHTGVPLSGRPTQYVSVQRRLHNLSYFKINLSLQLASDSRQLSSELFGWSSVIFGRLRVVFPVVVRSVYYAPGTWGRIMFSLRQRLKREAHINLSTISCLRAVYLTFNLLIGKVFLKIQN